MSSDPHTLTTRLAAVEAERDRLSTELLAFGEKYDSEDRRLDAEFKALESKLSAALARAERAENALEEPMRMCAQRASVIQILGHHPDMTIAEAYEAAGRAALSQGEETDAD